MNPPKPARPARATYTRRGIGPGVLALFTVYAAGLVGLVAWRLVEAFS